MLDRPRWVSSCVIALLFSHALQGKPSETQSLSILEAKDSFAAGDYALAERESREALAAAASPGQTVLAAGNLGVLLHMQGRIDESEAYLSRAVGIARTDHSVDARILPVLLGSLSRIYEETGRASLGSKTISEALKLGMKRLADQPEHLADLWVNAGILHFSAGKRKQAESDFKQAVLLLDRQGAYHPGLALVLTSMGTLYYHQHKWALAEAAYLRAIEITERSKGLNHPDLCATLSSLGIVYSQRGEFAEAELVLRRALAIVKFAYHALPPSAATIATALADVLVSRGHLDEAESLYAEVLEGQERDLGPRSIEVATTLQKFAALLHSADKPVRAREMESRSESIRFERTYTVSAKKASQD